MIQIKERSQLGNKVSLGGVAYLLEGIEDTLGKEGAEVIYMRAGKLRGRDLMKEAAEKYPERISDPEKGSAALVELMADDGLGVLLKLDAGEQPGSIRAEIAESMEGAMGSEERPAMYTAGFLAGLMEASNQVQFQVERIQVAKDGQPDIFEFVPLV